MRPTTLIGLAGLVVIGIIIADLITHPQGTQAAGNVLVNVTKSSEGALLGVAP